MVPGHITLTCISAHILLCSVITKEASWQVLLSAMLENTIHQGGDWCDQPVVLQHTPQTPTTEPGSSNSAESHQLDKQPIGYTHTSIQYTQSQSSGEKLVNLVQATCQAWPCHILFHHCSVDPDWAAHQWKQVDIEGHLGRERLPRRPVGLFCGAVIPGDVSSSNL